MLIAKRENNFDLLRCLASFCIVTLHVSATFIDGYRNGIDIPFHQTTTAVMINCFTRFSVPCFLMLTGAFVLNGTAVMDYRSFYKKSLRTIFAPGAVFICLHILYEILGALRSGNGFLKVVEKMITGDVLHLWYIYSLLIIYLILPFVKMVKERLSTKEYTIISIVYFCLSIVGMFTSSHLLKWDIGFCLELFGYVLIGDAICCIASKHRPLNKAGGGILYMYNIRCSTSLCFRHIVSPCYAKSVCHEYCWT